MEFKTYLQLFLLSIILFISIIFFKVYFFENKNDKQKIISEEKIKDEKSSTIKNIGYTAEDRSGNKYTIKSELADFNNTESNLIIMSNVKGAIDLINSSPIMIYSKDAYYDNLTFDTKFFNQVIIKYDHHTIKSNSLDLNFEKKLVTISGNVIYNELNTVMETDKIEIDLITKNSKIFMNNKKKKIKIKNTN